MSARDLNTVVALLPKLTKDEVRTVKALLAKLEAPSDEEPTLYRVLISLLGLRIPFSKFRSTTTYPHFVKNEQLVREFVESLRPGGFSSIALYAAMRMLISAVIDDMKHKKVPVTLHSVVVNLNDIEHKFDTMFPNYREAGMVSWVLKHLIKEPSHETGRAGLGKGRNRSRTPDNKG